jgi:hypothetical protein
MTAVLLPSLPVGFEALEAFATRHALPLRWAPPAAAGLQLLAVGAEDDRWLRLLTFSAQGCQLLLADEPELAAGLRVAFGAREIGEVLALPSDDPAEIVQLVGYAAALLQSGVCRGQPEEQAARELIIARLVSQDPIVRRLAGVLSWTLADEAGLEAVRAAAERFPDLLFAVDTLHQQLHEQAAGTLHDLPTTDTLELARRAREAAGQGQLERAKRTAELLLERQPWDSEGVYALGVGLSEDNPLAAAFLLGAASTAEDDAGQPEFPDAAARMAQLRELPVTPEQQQATEQLVLKFVRQWRGYSCAALSYGGAQALDGKLPSLQPLFSYLLGAWSSQIERLEQAAKLAPGVPQITLRWLEQLEQSEPERARAGMDALVEQLRQGLAPTPLEQQLEATLTGEGEPLTLGSLLARQAKAAYEAKDYDRAMQLATQALEHTPAELTALQVRALAATFSGRLEESLGAYAEALAAHDARYADGGAVFLSDPRPQMWFNRACTHAKLGRREAALEDLRRAVLGADRYAEEARKDDWFASLWEDPELLAIVAREPQALVLQEHRRPEHALALLGQAMDAENRGEPTVAAELAQQAALAAQLAGALPLQAEALAQKARTLALSGQLEPATQAATEAARLAEDPSVPPRVRGQVFAQVGLTRQAHGDLAGARAAYERSLAERRLASDGQDQALVARSELTLAALDLSEGSAHSALERALRALPILQQVVASGQAELTAHDDLVSAWLRQAAARFALGQHALAHEALTRSVEQVKRNAELGVQALPWMVQLLVDTADALLQAGVAEAGTTKAEARALLSTGHPEVDQILGVFRELRAVIAAWRALGRADADIASWISAATLGRELPAEIVQVHPLPELRPLFVRLGARHSTLLVTSAMALELLGTPGQLDKSLSDLEGLWVSAASAS